MVYGGCGADIGTAPSNLCHKGDPIGAFFKSISAGTVYDVCIEFLGGKPLCSRQQQAAAGVLYVNKITSGVIGETSITWYVNSAAIGTWTVHLYPDPVVPKFGINPLIVAKSHRLFGLVVRHLEEGHRVRAWRRCDGICPLSLRLARTKGKTRRYVVVRPAGGASFSLGETLYVQVDAPGQSDGNGSRLWGRLYTGMLIQDPKGARGDTSIRHIGPLLCTPPDDIFTQAVDCDRVE